MDGIIYEDILNHYVLKNNIVAEDIEKNINELKNISVTASEFWSGKSYEIFDTKMAEIIKSTQMIREDLDRISYLLCVVRDEYLSTLGI